MRCPECKEQMKVIEKHKNDQYLRCYSCGFEIVEFERQDNLDSVAVDSADVFKEAKK